MLIFVTSLRSRSLAQDWTYHLRLLDRTLASFLAQTDPDIRVVVVANEIPEVTVQDRRVHFLVVNYPAPPREFHAMTSDKVFKVTAGAQWAIEQGARFLMYADADDLVSRRLAAYARQHPDANGWYFPDGFSHRYGQPWLQRSRNHHMRCGTCAIFRTDHLRFERDPEYRGELVNTAAAFGHTGYRELMAKAGHPLEPLPFPGSVYVQHADSVVTVQPGGAAGTIVRGVLRSARDLARAVSAMRPLTPSLAREFTIPRTAP